MKLKVAIQGIKGSYHHQAAMMFFDCDPHLLECKTFREIPKAIKNNQADYGIMAIENSIAGSLLQNYRLLGKHGQNILGEIYIPIEHSLLALSGEKIENITEIRSHPMALLQCESFLDKYPHIKLVETSDTADSAREISQNQSAGIAAIAGEIAGSIYGLKSLKKNIQTIKNNYTRFFVIGNKKNDEISSGSDKASLRMVLGHKSGSLSQVLSIFSIHGMNLTKIQSVPIIEKPWQYSFYVDLLFPTEATFKSVLEVLKHQTEEVEVLGVYKEWKLSESLTTSQSNKDHNDNNG